MQSPCLCLLAVLLFALMSMAEPASLPTRIDDPAWTPLDVWKNKTRLWDRELLNKGILNLGNLAHFKRFFDKLERGEKIMMVRPRSRKRRMEGGR